VRPLVQFVAYTYGPEHLRQTPGDTGLWKDVQFAATAENVGADWLFIYNDEGNLRQTRVPLERRIIFLSEPPEIKNYYSHYLNQFGIVVSPMKPKKFKGVWIQRQGALPWHYAASYDELAAKDSEAKTAGLSVVCSGARKIPGHRRRFDFVSKLKEILGDRLHWYGRGVQEIATKNEAIAPFRYSIAIENNEIEHFFTEKLSDTFLGFSFPFYAGGPNLERYFDPGSFQYVDLDDPVTSANKLERAMDAGLYEERLPLIRESRRRVLDEYNLFNEAWKIIHQYGPSRARIPSLAKPVKLSPCKKGVRHWFLDQPRRVRRTAEWLKYRY
jgi:hypothetical protein